MTTYPITFYYLLILGQYFTNDAQTQPYYTDDAQTQAYSGQGGILTFTPLQLGSKLAAWYDPSDASTLTPTTGPFLQQSDKSGNNNTRISATTAQRPTQTTINGLNAMRCASLQGMTYPVSLASTMSGNHVVYRIVRLNDTTTAQKLMQGGPQIFSGSARLQAYYEYGTVGTNSPINNLGYNYGQTPKAAYYNIPAQDTNAHLVKYGVNSNTIFISQDGDAGGTLGGVSHFTAAGNVVTGSMSNIGNAHTTEDYGEEIILNANPTAQEDANIRAYLSRWGTFTPFVAPISSLRPASIQNRLPDNSGGSAGTNSYFARVPHYIARDMQSLTVNFYNFYNNGTSELPVGNVVTISSCALESNTGVVVPVTFGGNATYAMAATGVFDINSDSVPASSFSLSAIPGGTLWWLKFTYSFNASVSIALSSQAVADVSGTQSAFFVAANTTISSTSVAGPYTFTGTTPVSNTYCNTPVLLGVPVVDGPSFIGGCGDSIEDYVNDNAANVYGNAFFQRAMGTLQYPSINIARNGAASSLFTTGFRWKSYLKYVKYVVDEIGTNDIGVVGAYDLNDLTLALNCLWATYRQYGIRKIFRTKYLARTTSTDNWSTTTNQTPSNGWTTGGPSEQMNAYFDTAKTAGLVDYVVPMVSLRDGTNPTLWKVNGTNQYYTSDGTHPTVNGHPLLAAELVTSIQAANVT